MVSMVSNKDVFGYLKGNIGEESVLKMIIISAVKALVSVMIIVGGVISAMQLAEKYGSLNAYPTIFVFLIFSLAVCAFSLSGYRRNDAWRGIYRDIKSIQIRDMLYFDWDGYKIAPADQFMNYLISVICGGMITFAAMVIGGVLIFTGALIYAFFQALIIPSESLITICIIGGSILSMSLLFFKLKWRKIFLDGINWNLIAWCICGAIVITTMSFVAGVAIRRIAGYIGIEYTIGLISIYVIITAIYVITDLRQWMDNKARDALVAKTAEKMVN